MRDRLPAKVRATETGVVNLDKTTGPGTHWVAYRKIGNIVEYFDSFGVEPPSELLTYFGEKSVVYYSCIQEQRIDQINCGHRCLIWLSS